MNDENQAVLVFKEGVETFTYGCLATSETNLQNNKDGVLNEVEENHLKRYDKIIIPASVTNIDASTLANINKQNWTIEIEEGNTVYQVVDGKIAKI